MHLLGPAIVKKETYLGSNPGHIPRRNRYAIRDQAHRFF